jgi:hypothetical protein
MLYLILAAVAVVIGGIVGAVKAFGESFPSFWDRFFGAIAMAIVSSAVTLIALGIFSAILSGFVATKTVVWDTEYITALKDNSVTEGSFFLGSGTVDETPVYAYARKESGGIVIDSIPSDGVIIVEDSNERPRIENLAKEFKSEKLEEWFPLFSFWGADKVYVPEGSITTDFDIDLE